MKKIGSLLLFFGVGTIVLNLIGFEFAILGWIDNWGETVGWAIRGAMIVAGGALFFLGHRSEAHPSTEAPAAPRQEPTFGTAIPDTADPMAAADPAPAADPSSPPQQP